MFKEDSDPVGKVHSIPEIESKIQKYIELWDASKTKSFWKPKINFSKITNFLLFVIDDFISTLTNISIPGPDKKATVLAAVVIIYDYVIKEAMPIWLKPFAPAIKNYIIYILISNSIDWIVSKYQDKSWKPVETSALDRILQKVNLNCLPCRFVAKGGK